MNLYGYITFILYGVFELPEFKLDGYDCIAHRELDNKNEFCITMSCWDDDDNEEIIVSTVEFRNMLISRYNSGTVKMVMERLCGKKKCTDQELFEQVNKCRIEGHADGQINSFLLKPFIK